MESNGLGRVELGTAYLQLRPILLGMVARFVRFGHRMAPDEALDCVHDFFAAEWPALERTYDPSKGPLPAYVRRAFARFLLARSQRSARWRAILASSPCHESRHPVETTDAERRAFVTQLEQLPPKERTLLVGYLFEGLSERTLAANASTSRHAIRERLVHALAQVVAQWERPEAITRGDWTVALHLWKDAHTPQETANRLGLTRTQVVLARDRVLAFLGDALRTSHKS